MKRAIAGADGKNRSKGHPAPKKAKGRATGAGIKRSEHTTPVREQMQKAHEAKKAREGKELKQPAPANDNRRKPVKTGAFSRAKTAAKSSAENLKTVLKRNTGRTAPSNPTRGDKTAQKTPGEAGKRKPTVARPSTDRAAEHRMRQKRQETPKPAAPAKTITPIVRKGK
jgi:hypothetical protein